MKLRFNESPENEQQAVLDNINAILDKEEKKFLNLRKTGILKRQTLLNIRRTLKQLKDKNLHRMTVAPEAKKFHFDIL